MLFEQRTRQQQVTTSQLTESAVTTTTWPWQLQTTQLRTRVTPLNQNLYKLESRTYPLVDTSRQLEKNTFYLQLTTRPLESRTYQLTKVTTPLDKNIYNVTRTPQLLTRNTYKVTVGTKQLTKNIYKVTEGTRELTRNIYKVTVGTKQLTRNIYNVTRTTSPLQKSTFTLQKTTQQLQVMDNVSTDGGDTWHDTAWTDTASCTVTPGQVDTYTRNRRCQYAAPVVTTGLSSCTAVTASPGPTNYTVGQSAACVYEAAVVTAVGSCTTGSASGSSPYASYTTCAYGTAAAPVTNLTSCTANNQSGPSYTGDRVVCSYDAAPTTTNTNQSSCTWVVPSPSASAPRTDCSYQAVSNSSGQNSCTAAPLGTVTTNGTVWNTNVACSYDAAPSSTDTNRSNCTWVVPSPAASSSRTDCVYQAVSNDTGENSCTAAPLGTVTTNGTVWNTSVACSYDAAPSSTDTDQSSCTWVVPSPSASAPRTDCSYQAVSNVRDRIPARRPRWARSRPTVPSGTRMWPVPTTPTPSSTRTRNRIWSCTWVVPSPAASAPKTDCVYQAPGAGTPNQASCTAVAQGTVTTNGTVWPSAMACTYDAAPASTLTGQPSCTWVVPSPAASLPRTDCSYNAGAATTAPDQATCTPVAAGTATTNGSVWAGPSVACNWQAAVVATNLLTCTPSGSAAGPPYNQYTTCGYGTGVVATGLSSCTKDDPEAGPPYAGGQTVACAYQGTPVTTNVNSPVTCVTVAQDTTNFSAPQVTCSYAANVVTSDVANCSNVSMSGSSPYTVNIAHSCAYSGSTSASDLNATNCTANRQTSSPYTGPAVHCTYSGTATTSTGVPSCTWQDAQPGPAYTGGGRVTCSYGSAGGWSNVGAGTCTYNNPTATPGTTGTVYAPGVECAYNAPQVRHPGQRRDLPGHRCAGRIRNGNGTVYSTLQKKVCVAGAFPSVAAPVVSTPVNTCDTTPVHTNRRTRFTRIKPPLAPIWRP